MLVDPGAPVVARTHLTLELFKGMLRLLEFGTKVLGFVGLVDGVAKLFPHVTQVRPLRDVSFL